MNFYGSFFRWLQIIVRKFYPTYSVQLPKNHGPVVYVCHHQNLFGPFVTMLWSPESLHIWVLHVFLYQKVGYKHFVDYTFTKRFKWNKVFSQVCAYPLSYLASKLLNSAKAIPVYRGSRKIIQTFKESVASLSKGENIAICPDIDYQDPSSITKDMYDGFLYLEKYYFQSTGRHLCFTPLYVSKKKRSIIANQSIYFRDGYDFNEERKVVYEKIHSNLNDLAKKCGDVA